jgi:hypothetical protein
MIYGSKKENMINTNIYKMKTKLTLVLLVLGSFFANAQTPEKCNEDLQLFAQFAKTKEFDEAYKYLNPLREHCPKLNKAIYLYGEYILKHKIDNATTPEEKEDFVRDLNLLYTQLIVIINKQQQIILRLLKVIYQHKNFTLPIMTYQSSIVINMD